MHFWIDGLTDVCIHVYMDDAYRHACVCGMYVGVYVWFKYVGVYVWFKYVGIYVGVNVACLCL